MIVEDRMAKILLGMWICELRQKNDPQYDIKVATIKECMKRYGVDGMDTFDTLVDDLYNRHFSYK